MISSTVDDYREREGGKKGGKLDLKTDGIDVLRCHVSFRIACQGDGNRVNSTSLCGNWSWRPMGTHLPQQCKNNRRNASGSGGPNPPRVPSRHRRVPIAQLHVEDLDMLSESREQHMNDT